MTDNAKDDWFSRLEKKLSAQPRCSPEESAQYAAERKAREGTMFEWAQMQQNGEIAVRISDYFAGGGHGGTNFVIAADEEAYEQAKLEYGLEQPGDTRHIVKRWIDGQWMLEKSEKNNYTGDNDSFIERMDIADR
jgi:hypothetical protein